MTAPRSITSKDPLQIAAAVVGGVFLLVGILGFIPGIVSNFDALSAFGRQSDAKLLGLFEISVLHNLVHVLFGVAGLALARTRGAARAFLVGGGAIYLVLWLYGLVIQQDSALNFVPVNTADNWLHFALGTTMVAVGMLLASRTVTTTAPPATTGRTDRPLRARA